MEQQQKKPQCTKACYQGRKEAKKTMKHLNKTKQRGLTNVYWCDDCRAYHLTSKGKQSSRDLTRHLNKNK